MSRNSYFGPKLGLWKFWETWPNSQVGSKRERWGDFENWIREPFCWQFCHQMELLCCLYPGNWSHSRIWIFEKLSALCAALNAVLPPVLVIKHLFRSCFFDILTCEQRKKAPGGFSYIGSVYYPVIVGMNIYIYLHGKTNIATNSLFFMETNPSKSMDFPASLCDRSYRLKETSSASPQKRRTCRGTPGGPGESSFVQSCHLVGFWIFLEIPSINLEGLGPFDF